MRFTPVISMYMWDLLSYKFFIFTLYIISITYYVLYIVHYILYTIYCILYMLNYLLYINILYYIQNIYEIYVFIYLYYIFCIYYILYIMLECVSWFPSQDSHRRYPTHIPIAHTHGNRGPDLWLGSARRDGGWHPRQHAPMPKMSARRLRDGLWHVWSGVRKKGRARAVGWRRGVLQLFL